VRDLRYRFSAVEDLLRGWRGSPYHQAQERHCEAAPARTPLPPQSFRTSSHVKKKTFGKKRLKVSGAEQLAAERERFLIVYADHQLSLLAIRSPDAQLLRCRSYHEARQATPRSNRTLRNSSSSNALNWRIFRKELRASEEQGLSCLSFSKDIHAGVIRIVPLSAATFVHARRIARTQTGHLGTRALDVLHVASALALRAGSFYTFDKNQARLATALGLRIP